MPPIPFRPKLKFTSTNTGGPSSGNMRSKPARLIPTRWQNLATATLPRSCRLGKIYNLSEVEQKKFNIQLQLNSQKIIMENKFGQKFVIIKLEIVASMSLAILEHIILKRDLKLLGLKGVKKFQRKNYEKRFNRILCI